MKMLLDKIRLVLFGVLLLCMGMLMSTLLGHMIAHLMPELGGMLLDNIYLTSGAVTMLMIWLFRDKVMKFIKD